MNKPFSSLRLSIAARPRLWLSRLVFALGPVLTFCMVEILDYNNPFGLELWRLAWSIGWYWVIFIFFWLLFGGRRCSGGVAASVFLYIAGLINHYVLRFRGTMFFPIDILSWRTAVNVAAGYDYTPDAPVWWALLILCTYIALLLFTKQGGRGSGRSRIGAACGLTSFFLIFFATGLLPSVELYAEQWNTQQNGFVFNFMVSLRYSYVTEPEDYSVEVVEDIQETVITESQEEPGSEVVLEDLGISDPVKPTNIIVIMNESLGDLSIYPNFPVNRDPLSFIHSMEENTIKGWFYSPVFGGGTANVEYEVLTGNPSCFLPDGTVAYQLYLDRDTPSLAWQAREEGYTTYAFHPYLSSGWNRMQAYDYLGFEHQLYDDDVENPDYVRDFISDSCDFGVLKSITEENDGPVFIFNVTMQNHSGYGMEWTNLPYTIHLIGDYKDSDYVTEQYLNLAYESDRAFEELIDYYSRCSEPTVIAMFGDHQPPLSNEFMDILRGGPEAGPEGEESLEKYITPFVIWANYDIPEQQELKISANFFGVLVSQLAGFERTYFMELLCDIMDEFAVVHKYGYIDHDGNYYSCPDELPDQRRQLIADYEKMSYHDLFDREECDEFYGLEPDVDGEE